jgi:hypothetical protein
MALLERLDEQGLAGGRDLLWQRKAAFTLDRDRQGRDAGDLGKMRRRPALRFNGDVGQ